MGEFTADERAAVIAAVVGSQALAGVAVTPGEAGALLDGLAGTPLPPIGAAGGEGAMGAGRLTEAQRARVYDPTVPDAERLALALRWLAELRALEAEVENCYHWRRNDCTPNDSE